MSSLQYEIRVSGVVPDSLLKEIEGVRVVVEPVQTVLRGPALDQAALHGIINRLAAMATELVSAPANLARREARADARYA